MIFFILGFEGIELMSKIVRYLFNCGWATADIKEELAPPGKAK